MAEGYATEPIAMIYITTPIYYPNDRPHLGTAYTTLVADAVARYWRLKGEEVFSLTGTDEHGLKIARAAEESGMSPQEWVDHIVERFYEAWAMLDIEYDDFIRTTEPRHTGSVRKLLGAMHDAGDVYEHRYEGPYCVACEAYYAEGELIDGRCPIHERPVETHAEDNYFFRLSAYGDRLLAHIEANPDFVTPVTRRNEVVSFIEQGLRWTRHMWRMCGWMRSSTMSRPPVSSTTTAVSPVSGRPGRTWWARTSSDSTPLSGLRC